MNPRRVVAVARRIAQGFRRDERSLVLPADVPAAIQSGKLSLTLITAGTDPISDGPRIAAIGELLRDAAKSLAPPGAVALAPDLTRETVYLSPDANQVDVLAPVFLGL